MSYDDLQRAIRQRDAAVIVRLMFEGSPPIVRSGYRTETEFFDYKRDCPKLGVDFRFPCHLFPQLMSQTA